MKTAEPKKRGPKPSPDSLVANINAKVTAADLRVAAEVRRRLGLAGNSALVRRLLRDAAKKLKIPVDPAD